jgi:hypothetical protein
MKVQLYQVAGGECHTPATEDLLLIERGGDHVTQYLKWSTLLASLDISKTYVDAQDALFVKLDGSRSMTGALVLANDPLNDLEATTKRYVDAWAVTVEGELAGRLSLAGGTMQNPIFLSGDPTEDLHAATKHYVDATAAAVAAAQLAGKLDLAGGTMTGELILFSDPMTAMAAATKQYADQREQAARDYADTKLSKAGGQMTGSLILTGAVSGDPFEAVAKMYVDGLADGLYGQIATVNATASAALPIAGGTMTGALVLSADPAEALEAATKQYVDNHASTPTAGTTNYAASLALDFNGNSYQTIALAGDLSITGTNNKATAKTITIRLVGDGSIRSLAFPASWRFFGIKPTTLAANKEAILSLTCFGANETDVRAAFSAEQ